MKLTDRLQLIKECQLFGPRHGVFRPHDLDLLVQHELGAIDVFEREISIPRHTLSEKALPPLSIYHICAGNLSVSAETSLLLGLILGSQLTFKLPSKGLSEFSNFVNQLPTPFRDKITLRSASDYLLTELQRSDVVVVYGSDETIKNIRKDLLPHQRFLSYGHKVSLGIIPNLTDQWSALATKEMSTHGQFGCLSPSAYLCSSPKEAETFGHKLADSLEQLEKTLPRGALDFELSAMIDDYRQRHRAKGNLVIHSEGSTLWTVTAAVTPCPIEVSPGGRTISVIPIKEYQDSNSVTPKAFADFLKLHPNPYHFSAISLGISNDTSEWKKWITALQLLPISRVCQVGKLQEPSILWKHDSHPRLSEMIRWITVDI